MAHAHGSETHGGGAEALPPLWQAPDAQECVDEDAEGMYSIFGPIVL